MTENQNQNSIGETLRKISNGDTSRKIHFDEEKQVFVIKKEDEEVAEGLQDATLFAEEGYA